MRSVAYALPLLVACGGDDVPLADAEAVVTIDEDGVAEFTLGGTDARGKDADLTVSIDAPADGTISADQGPAPLQVTWTPPANWAGATALSFTVTDEDGLVSAPRNVGLVVNPIDDPPTVVDDAVTTDSVTPIEVHPLANDSDVEEDPIVIATLGQPTSGTAVLEGATTVRYTPVGSFAGDATFTYTARDALGATAMGTVTVTVTPGTPLVIDRFDALPAWPLVGQSVTLVWETTGATSCALDRGAQTNGATSGSTGVIVQDTTVWTLTCEGPGGPVQALVAVDPWPTDIDGDGLSDLGEIALGADPLASDTDGDGLPDGKELDTEPTDPDSDDDGWPDGLEDVDLDGRVDLGELDPARPDSNGDGICDGPRAGDLPADDCVDPVVWYVDASVTGLQNGVSWGTAFGKVQYAVDAATPGDHVWVAGGRYRPDAATLSVVNIEGRTVHLIGGFAGGEDTILDRPWPPEETILDGDFDGDGTDPGNSASIADNSKSVVRVVDGGATLAGFVITAGRGREITPGVPPEVNAGIDAARSMVRVVQSRIEGNRADRGAAAGGDQVGLRIARTVMTDNHGGGACFSFTASDIAIADAALVDNGLPVLTMTGGTVEVVRSRIAGNPSGTGAFFLSNVDARLFDTEFVDNNNVAGTCCNAAAITITGNQASLVGLDVSFVGNDGGFGAISVSDAPTTLTNVSFVSNVPSGGFSPPRGGAITGCNAPIAVRNALFQGNGTADVASRGCTTGMPVVTDSASNLALGGSNVLVSNASIALPSGEVVLKATGGAVDEGSSAPAEDPVNGYPAFGAVWSQRASTEAFVEDEPPIDVGRHFGRDRAVIRAFSADATSASWDVAGARECELAVEGDPVLIVDWPSGGEADHGGVSGDDLALTCASEWGDRAIQATVSVP